MKIIQQKCGACAGMGKLTSWKITNNGTAEKVEDECYVCGGKGYDEYAVFTKEEAQAILKHCGIIASEIGDI